MSQPPQQQQQQQIDHNEQIMLQQMTQLSPFKPTNSTASSVTMDITDEEKAMITMDFDYTPEYLCETNSSLEDKIKCILPTTIKLEDLREIALITHKIMSIEMIQSLWVIYYKSGTGNLPMSSSMPMGTTQVDGNIWPQAIQIMKRLCQLKSNQEMTKHEVDLLRLKISSHLTTHLFECESIASSALINSITNKKLQKQYYEQYKAIAEQSRTKMMNDYMECAESQKQQAQHYYETEMKIVQESQQLTSSMWNIVKQRLANINARVEYRSLDLLIMHSQRSNIQLSSQPTGDILQTLTPTITIASHQRTTKNKRRQRKRCSEKQRLRRFNKKCIRKGFNNEERQQLIAADIREKNNRATYSPMSHNHTVTTMDVMTTTEKTKINRRKSNKRKRLSTPVNQPSAKKSKKLHVSTTVLSKKETNKKLPQYLKKAPNILVQNLRLQLKKKLNKFTHKQFVYQRLRLLDQQYRLDRHRNLWQSYLIIGSEHQLWPAQVCKLTKSNDHQRCQQYVISRVTDLNQQYDQCTSELQTQSTSCPLKLSPLDKLEYDIAVYVD
ncbi:unnamed protein product, partial [Adineta ricciae]